MICIVQKKEIIINLVSVSPILFFPLIQHKMLFPKETFENQMLARLGLQRQLLKVFTEYVTRNKGKFVLSD